MFNMDKLKQAGSLMKKMNGLKKKIDKLETIAESKDGNIRVVVQGTSNIKSIKIDTLSGQSMPVINPRMLHIVIIIATVS